MTIDDIDVLVTSFGNAARRCAEGAPGNYVKMPA